MKRPNERPAVCFQTRRYAQIWRTYVAFLGVRGRPAKVTSTLAQLRRSITSDLCKIYEHLVRSCVCASLRNYAKIAARAMFLPIDASVVSKRRRFSMPGGPCIAAAENRVDPLAMLNVAAAFAAVRMDPLNCRALAKPRHMRESPTARLPRSRHRRLFA